MDDFQRCTYTVVLLSSAPGTGTRAVTASGIKQTVLSAVRVHHGAYLLSPRLDMLSEEPMSSPNSCPPAVGPPSDEADDDPGIFSVRAGGSESSLALLSMPFAPAGVPRPGVEAPNHEGFFVSSGAMVALAPWNLSPVEQKARW